MPNCVQVTSAVKEQVIVGTGKKGFFRRIAEKMGLVQREVAECRGKSLSEIAEMTSKKDIIDIISPEGLEERIQGRLRECYNIQQRLVQLKGGPVGYERSKNMSIEEAKRIATLRENAEINKLKTKVEEVEARIKHEQPYKADNGYSPDGDHIYGSSEAESWEHFLKRIDTMKKKELEPLQEELKILIAKRDKLPIQVKEWLQMETDLKAQLRQLTKQAKSDIDAYRQLVISRGGSEKQANEYLNRLSEYFGL